MFDGEEVNEKEEGKDRNIEEGAGGLADVESQDEESKKTDEIELKVLNGTQVADDETKETGYNCGDNGIDENEKSVQILEESTVKTILEVANTTMPKDDDGGFSAVKNDDDSTKVCSFNLLGQGQNLVSAVVNKDLRSNFITDRALIKTFFLLLFSLS